MFARLQLDLNFFQQDLKELSGTTGNPLAGFRQVYLGLLDHQKKLLLEMNQRSEFDEELIRKYLSLIDLEEFKIREKQLKEIQGMKTEMITTVLSGFVIRRPIPAAGK